MWIADRWKEYNLIDGAKGEKLEKWGEYILRRPDPQAIWENTSAPDGQWQANHAHYFRSATGGGHWKYNQQLPDAWQVHYDKLTFNIKPMGFKHTGLFPEQAVNWDWFSELIKASNREIRVLNLFAYTGGATVAAAAAGANVVHVDASKGMVNWAKENLASSSLSDRSVRFIVDDVLKFVMREQRRGNKYDAIIMDPPSYGRGPSGEIWKIEDELYPLICECIKLFSTNPLFFLVNSYTTGLSKTVTENILRMNILKTYGGVVAADEIGLKMQANGLVLPCGMSARWSR